MATIDEFGFEAVDAGPLTEGWRIQRDTPGYGPQRTADELRNDLAAARRYADRQRFAGRCPDQPQTRYHSQS
ncbi:MAG TPA: hypothetical protein VLN08_12985 [Vicinamibacterales bacterium]|nr:hypothetical protein [Vicinamibacterales bacterium]